MSFRELFLTFLSSVVLCYANPNVFASRSDLSLAKFMMQQSSQQALRADPETSSKCFALHLPLLEKVANQWSLDHNSCINSANEQRNGVVAGMKDEENALSTTAMNVCQYISKCQNINETMDFLKCFSQLGAKSFNTIYSVSNNASDAVASLLQQLEVVDVEMYKCTNVSERTYIKDSANVYDALNKCLQNGATDDNNTSSTTSTTTTTNIPTTSTTEDDSTVQPVTTSTSELPTDATVIDSEPLPEEDIRLS